MGGPSGEPPGTLGSRMVEARLSLATQALATGYCELPLVPPARMPIHA